jgi:signal transduction histidine kinase
VPTDRRTEEEIRREITTEREHLREALADLRAGVDAKRRPAALVGGALAAGLAAAVVARMTRRLRNG